MKQNKVWRELMTLPPEIQQQVFDFIDFLHSRYSSAPKTITDEKKVKLREEPFIGIWKDRAEMADSTEWVRNLRKQEWG